VLWFSELALLLFIFYLALVVFSRLKLKLLELSICRLKYLANDNFYLFPVGWAD
jgi:hypothetical protein